MSYDAFADKKGDVKNGIFIAKLNRRQIKNIGQNERDFFKKKLDRKKY